MTDYGPLSTIDRKGRVTLPPDLIIHDRPDPQNPNRTVRGGHRVDRVAEVLGGERKAWQQENRLRYWAAEIYRTDMALAGGASPDPRDHEPGSERVSSDYSRLDGQIDAIGRHRAAYEAIPVRSRPVVVHVVHRGWKLSAYASGRGYAVARVALMVGLDALARHYEGMGR